MTEAPMTGLERQPVATAGIAFCSRCGRPWVADSEACAGCEFRLDDGRGNVAPAKPAARKPLAAILNAATLIAVVLAAGFVFLSLGGLDRRMAAVEKATAAMSNWHADLVEIGSTVSDISRTVSDPSTPDYSSDLRSISSDLANVSDMVFEVDSTVRSIRSTTDIICSAVPGC